MHAGSQADRMQCKFEIFIASEDQKCFFVKQGTALFQQFYCICFFEAKTVVRLLYKEKNFKAIYDFYSYYSVLLHQMITY